MSIKIEILDYVYGTDINIVDALAYSSIENGAFTVTDKHTIVCNNSGTGLDKIYDICDVISGKEYLVSFEISNYSGSGDMGFAISSVGVPLTLRGNSDGVYTDTFIATASGSLDMFGYDTNAGTIKNISIELYNVINWTKSIVGELDVTSHEDFPLALTFAISDIKNIDARSGVYSKTFKIPATKHNNKLLKNIFVINSHINNNILGKKRCRITLNGLPALEGLIKITGNTGYGRNPSNYSCVFFGNNLSWAKEIEDKSLSDIDWGSSGEDLATHRTDIETTWAYSDSTSSSSPIVYPIASYGRINENGTEGTIQLLNTRDETGGVGGQDGYYGFGDNGWSYGTPPPELDWRPMVWVKDTINKIFESSGYTIVSDFMNTQMFKQLVWALPNVKFNEKVSKSYYESNTVLCGLLNGISMDVSHACVPSFVAEFGVMKMYNSFYSENDGYKYVELDINSSNLDVELDQNSRIDNPSNTITMGRNGYYDVKLDGLKIKVAEAFKGGSDRKLIYRINADIHLQVQTVGETSWRDVDVTGTYWEFDGSYPYDSSEAAVSCGKHISTSYRDLSGISHRRYFNEGDKIRFNTRQNLWSNDNSQDFGVYLFIKATDGARLDVKFDSQYLEYGQAYNLSDVINSEYKQMDFVKGISHAFNLQMTTHETERIIYIEPFNDFYQPKGTAIDWTAKLARDKDLSSKWIKSDLKRNIVFKYKSDSKDRKVEERGKLLFGGVKDEHPYLEDLGEQWEKGSSKFENPFFAGTYCDKDTDITTSTSSTFNTACLWEEDNLVDTYSRGEKGFGFEPRLLYWDRGLSGNANRSFSYENWGGNYQSYNTNIPQAVSYDTDNINSPNLCYGNVSVTDYDSATNTFAPQVSHSGLYETYYKGIMEVLFQNPRVITAYFDLKIIDIINLDFRKLVYVDGVYYRINKISDYAPHKNTPTKVELIQWIN